MNQLKTYILPAISALLIISCKTQQPKIQFEKHTPITVPVVLSKKSELKEPELKRWSLLDIQKDSVPGMSVDRAYSELIKNQMGKKVIVAVIDSGVDIEHEDLKQIIWTNTKEIPANGIDDDKNGYIDDINGWNYLGDVTKENLEYQRILNNKKLVDEATYQRAVTENNTEIAEAPENKSYYENVLNTLKPAHKIISDILKKENYTIDQVKEINTTDEKVIGAKKTIVRMFFYEMSMPNLKKFLTKKIQEANELLDPKKTFTNYRKPLGDNPEDIKDTKYGNNNVMGPDKEEILHGTHVAGIIGQVRNNNIGSDGVANNVAIMVLRAVPDGDEYDKDIALAIRYAVDNGAKVINGSFGKAFSPQKKWVFDAIKYAEKKDVLIVHAAGNASKNLDYFDNYPNDSEDKIKEFADNLITIGALNFKAGNKMVATFSNIGKINVDVFAPGVKIYATIPDNNYKYLQGTSMASPNVAGVAALIRSYFPKLTASQVKHILMDSGVAIKDEVMVAGNPKDNRPFDELSKTGKIVNAYNALLMAEELSKK
ncbi:MAG: cell wall-associated protease [Bacteroidota bacterium]|nr:cell wall-associated protease [Bacteroidota bacterium]